MGRSLLPVPATRARAGHQTSHKFIPIFGKTTKKVSTQLSPATLPSSSDQTTTHPVQRSDSAYTGLGYSCVAPTDMLSDPVLLSSDLSRRDSIPARRRSVVGSLARRSSNERVKALVCRLDERASRSSTADGNSVGRIMLTREMSSPSVATCGGSPPDVDQETTPASFGKIFGVDLDIVRQYGCCDSLVGGRVHPLPVVVFATVEYIASHGGASNPALFNLMPTPRLRELLKIFDTGPLYGDTFMLDNESMQDVSELFRLYFDRLPNPVLDPDVRSAFLEICVASGQRSATKAQISAAQVLLRLLRPAQFRVFAYVLAFLSELPRQANSMLDVNTLSTIFGDSLLSARQPAAQATRASRPRKDKKLASYSLDSCRILAWLLRHWKKLAEGLFAQREPGPVRSDVRPSGARNEQGPTGAIPAANASTSRPRLGARRPSKQMPEQRVVPPSDKRTLAREPARPSPAIRRDSQGDEIVWSGSQAGYSPRTSSPGAAAADDEAQTREAMAALRARVLSLEQEQKEYRERASQAEDALHRSQEKVKQVDKLTLRLQQCKEQLASALRRAETAESERDQQLQKLELIQHIVVTDMSQL